MKRLIFILLFIHTFATISSAILYGKQFWYDPGVWNQETIRLVIRQVMVFDVIGMLAYAIYAFIGHKLRKKRFC